MLGTVIPDPRLACWQSTEFKISDAPHSPVLHSPGSVTVVHLPKYTISWDGSAECDPGEILFDCIGCEEHQVRLDQQQNIFYIETTDESISAFPLILTVQTTAGLKADDFALEIQLDSN